jgi:hypothetical protein
LLQSMSTETDPARKLSIMEEFAAAHPQHEATGWVYSQMQVLYNKSGDSGKAIATGEKLLAMDGDDLDAAYANLKAAEAKKDAAAVIKWSGETSRIARKTVASTKPSSGEEEWRQAVDYAKQVDTYTEYSLYAAALASTDPAKAMDLVEALQARNGKSQYLPQVLGKYAVAARQANALPKAVTLGEKAYADGVFNEDLLLTMADATMQNKDLDKTVLYGTKAADAMATAAKPEGFSDADWEKKKASVIGLGNWMAGMALAGQNKFPQADKSLRAALPYIKGNDQLMGPALFNLGLANYKMGQGSKNKAQIADAVRFSEQAAAIKGPMQAQAAKNVTVIKKEFLIK